MEGHRGGEGGGVDDGPGAVVMAATAPVNLLDVLDAVVSMEGLVSYNQEDE